MTSTVGGGSSPGSHVVTSAPGSWSPAAPRWAERSRRGHRLIAPPYPVTWDFMRRSVIEPSGFRHTVATIATVSRRGPSSTHLRVVAAAALAGPGATFAPGLTPACADPIGDQRQEAAQIAAQLEQLGNQSVTLGDQYEQALSDLDAANSAVADQKVKVAGLEQQVGTMRAAVSHLAVQSVVGSGESAGGLGTLLGRGESITETVERDQYTKLVVAAGADSTDQLEAGLHQLQVEKARLDDQQKKAKGFVASVNARKTEVELKTTQYEDLQRTAQARLGSLLVEAQQQRDAEEQRAALASKPPPTTAAPTTSKSSKSSGNDSGSGNGSSSGSKANAPGTTADTNGNSSSTGGSGNGGSGNGGSGNGGSSGSGGGSSTTDLSAVVVTVAARAPAAGRDPRAAAAAPAAVLGVAAAAEGLGAAGAAPASQVARSLPRRPARRARSPRHAVSSASAIATQRLRPASPSTAAA